MKRLTVLVAVALVAASACAPAPEPVAMAGSADDENAIRTLMQDVAAAYNAADAAAMTAMVTEDYQGLNPEGVHVQGRAAYQEQITQDFAAPRPEGFALTLETGYIHWHTGDLASVGGTYAVAGLPEGAPNTGSWLVTMERSGDGWLMSNALVAQFVPDPPADAGGAGGA